MPAAWKKPLRAVAAGLAFGSAGLGALHFVRAQSLHNAAVSGPKLLAEALSPYVAVAGAVGAGLGVWLGAPLTVAAGAVGRVLSGRYVLQALRDQGGLARAFGPDWRLRLSQERLARLPHRRWPLGKADGGEPSLNCDVVFYTLPGGRELLCDIWQPGPGEPRSGLAFIYAHGSGWHFLDKDTGTRPMFRRLAAQGHVVMDVAYRLCPETDWRGMLHDVQHAIDWMKANGPRYGVDPERVVVAGASAGGHLALLAAYTAGYPELIAGDLQNAELSVRGVVNWYGPTDMRAYYEHAMGVLGAIVGEGEDSAASRLSGALMKALGFEMPAQPHWQPGLTVQDAMMQALLGGTPVDIPEDYRAASPATYAGPDSPPTLLLQGEHDSLVPVEATRAMARQLAEAGARVVYVEYPQTEHAFDLIFPGISPVAQAAQYEVEYFLAMLE